MDDWTLTKLFASLFYATILWEWRPHWPGLIWPIFQDNDDVEYYSFTGMLQSQAVTYEISSLKQ